MTDDQEDAPLSFAKLLEGETCDEMIQSTIRWVRANATWSYDRETKILKISCLPHPQVAASLESETRWVDGRTR